MKNIKLYKEAYRTRTFNSFYDENPKSYNEDSLDKGEFSFNNMGGKLFLGTSDFSDKILSNELSPITNKKLNISYQFDSIDRYVLNAKIAMKDFELSNINSRFTSLVHSLDSIRDKFFDLAYATMHTTGQSFMMAFQASGPHAADRALESLVAAYNELTVFSSNVNWIKDYGKFKVKIEKDFIPVPKGIALSIGCSTFPTWNSVSGIYANLMCGNPVLVKPHPRSILPIAMFVKAIRESLKDGGMDENMIQLVPDTLNNPITRQLAEHRDIKIIDYTGGNEFGNYIEGLGKVSFTEKAGVNCCIVDSGDSLESICSNLAFSISLYSGQMCTAPQNIFIPEDGLLINKMHVSYDDFVNQLKLEIEKITSHPKASLGTFGAINNERTINSILSFNKDNNVILESKKLDNNVYSPLLIERRSEEYGQFSNECFGPISFVIKTKNTLESLKIAEKLALEKGALTCLVYCRNNELIQGIKSTMNRVFVPVSFNLSGAAFVNQHAAFSDLHVTGGNAAGNATFTNSEFISKRFVWVGNRYM